MMNKIGVLVLVYMFTVNAYSQSMEKIFDQDTIVFYGIDFTYLKAIKGLRAYGNMEKAVDYDFPDMNRKLVVEKTKFKFKEWFQLEGVQYDYKMVQKLNKKVNPDSIIIEPDDFKRLTKDGVKKQINSYKLKQTKGTGLVILYETWQKGEILEWDQHSNLSFGTFIYVFFDISNGDVLYAKHFRHTGGGIGNSNFWLKTIYTSGIQLSEELAVQKKAFDKQQKKKADKKKK